MKQKQWFIDDICGEIHVKSVAPNCPFHWEHGFGLRNSQLHCRFLHDPHNFPRQCASSGSEKVRDFVKVQDLPSWMDPDNDEKVQAYLQKQLGKKVLYIY